MTEIDRLSPSEVLFNGKIYDCNNGATYYQLGDVWESVIKRPSLPQPNSEPNRRGSVKSVVHKQTGMIDGQPTGDKKL